MFPSYPYYFSGNEGSLVYPKHGAFGANIAADGRDLTITFLSLNRPNLSIRLLESICQKIPHFAGEVLVVDNGSEPQGLDEIKAYCTGTSLKVRFVELGKNFGVAGGRNRALAAITTDWALCLDNDIYFVADPLSHIQRDLAVTGAHFLSLPLLNPTGETIYAYGGILTSKRENDSFRLSIASVVETGSPLPSDANGTPMLCTFLYGGASVLNRHTFTALGGFDESMLVGFEDLDFSLRAFRCGYKVASSTILALVHDHAKKDSDSVYERIRYGRTTLNESAAYLEGKTGYRVWGADVENWLRANEEKHGWPSVQSIKSCPESPEEEVSSKPYIALITDTDDWAFSRISHQIERHLSHKYRFSRISLVELAEIHRAEWLRGGAKGHFAEGGSEAFGMALVATSKADITHIFWREYLNLIDKQILKSYALELGLTYEQFRKTYVEDRILSTSVYDHLFLGEKEIAERAYIFDLVSGYYVSSEKLDVIYKAISGYPTPKAIIQDGVDLDLFRPKNLERFSAVRERELVLGWVGNSAWASTLGDFKGVHSILIPAVDDLRAEGVPVRLDIVDRQKQHIWYEEMPEYYATIDVYVCTSQIEGTPNPVLEAMACGVPVISTDVGIVPEVFGTLQRQFILRKRSVEVLKDAIRRLVSEPELLLRLSEENLSQIQNWSWVERVKNFDRYFESLLDSRAVARGENRTKICMLPFTTPSMETTGDIRLCSASSIFDYREETNMGNCRTDGLGAVWTGEKYRRIRQTLFTGTNLTPYCSRCEYRFDGPAWFMRLHLALHAYHHGVRSPDVIDLIREYSYRFREYTNLASAVSVAPYSFPVLPANARSRRSQHFPAMPAALVSGESLPIYLDLNTLNRCNVSCVMCPPAIRYDDLKQPKDPLYRLTLDEYKSVTAGLRIATAHFVGAYAEPLMNKEIVELVAYAHSRGAFTAITTNATLLTERLSEALMSAGLDMMSISLHGATRKIAEQVMRKSNFDKVIQNIKAMQELKRNKGTRLPEIYFNFVGQRQNIEEFSAFIDLAADLCVKYVNLIHLIDGDKAVDKTQNLIHYPDKLIPAVREARARAEAVGVVLTVSPAYAGFIDQATTS
jgi:MoaA/NifB/PqqE/SkfB family radical SAM enzyme/GT2 family glycosyltransferase